METEIDDIIVASVKFVECFGVNPDLQQIIKEYKENQIELGEDYDENFSPKTVFEAFCEFFVIGKSDYNRGIFDAIRKKKEYELAGFTLTTGLKSPKI